MDNVIRNLHPHVHIDQWRRLGYVDYLSQARQNDLARSTHPPAVHPLFQYRSPNGSKIWLGHSPTSFQPIYDALEPTLSLATAILLSPASLVFIYSVLYSPRRLVANPSMHEGQQCYVFARPNPLPDETILRQRVFSALEKLADSNAFVLMDENDYPGMKDVHGLTVVMQPATKDGICITDDNRRGLPTGIRIHKRYVHKLIAWGADPTIVNRLVVLNTQFRLASTICHEIVHALNDAIDTPLLRRVQIKLASNSVKLVDSNEPFWEDQRLAELGAAWESEVFGGTIREDPAGPEGPLLVCKWPGLENRGKLPQTKGPKKMETRYFIDMHFIHDIQQRSFWNQSLAHDTTLLHIPKTLGKRFDYMGDDIDPDWSPTNSSEGIPDNPGSGGFVRRGGAARYPVASAIL